MKSNSRERNASFESVDIRTAHDIVGRFAFPFYQQVGFANGVRLSIDFLTVQMRCNLFAVLFRKLL